MKEYGKRLRLTPAEEQIITKHRNLKNKDEQKPTGELPRKIPKYLLIDIETLPATALVFGLFKQTIPYNNLISDVCVVCWSAKWLYDSDMMSDCMTPQEAIDKNDKRIMISLWRLLEAADVIIGHNSNRFDLRIINSRMFYHKIKPPSPYQTVDTLKASQKALATISHRLDYLGKFMDKKGKLHTDFGLWKKCYFGDKESLDYMLKYNKEDVLLLEELYLELRPWIRPHPNYAIYSESQEPCCIYCGSNELFDSGIYVTQAGRFLTQRCYKCGGIMRVRTSDMKKIEKNNLSISISR